MRNAPRRQQLSCSAFHVDAYTNDPRSALSLPTYENAMQRTSTLRNTCMPPPDMYFMYARKAFLSSRGEYLPRLFLPSLFFRPMLYFIDT